MDIEQPKERMIFFSGPMVRAVQEGRKTQTRRVLKPRPVGFVGPYQSQEPPFFEWCFGPHNTYENGRIRWWECPYGQPGDRILVPWWASHITLEITAVRVERLRDITEEDAIAEGVRSGWGPVDGVWKFKGFSMDQQDPYVFCETSAVGAFSKYWDSLYSERPDRMWAMNPWVWVVEFKMIKQKEMEDRNDV